MFMRVWTAKSLTRVARVARVQQATQLIKFHGQMLDKGLKEIRSVVVIHPSFRPRLLILYFLPPGISSLVTAWIRRCRGDENTGCASWWRI